MEKETVQIRTEFIKLQDLLKFAGAVETWPALTTSWS